MKRTHFFKWMLTTVLLVIAQQLTAQEPQYTQYMYNTQVINPAISGTSGHFTLGFLHRSQWMGLEGAPKTQTLHLSAPVTENVGLGFSIINDNIGNGTNQNTYLDGSFSYALKLSEKAVISLGLKAGGHLLDVNVNKLENFNPLPGQVELLDINKKFIPNIGLGAYYYTDKFYAGLSLPNILESESFKNSDNGSAYLVKSKANIYFTTGYVFNLSTDFKFRPSMMLRTVNDAPSQIDVSANFLFKDAFNFGLSYRYQAAVSALAGFQITPKAMIGIAYDTETSQLGGTVFNANSFEVVLQYNVFTGKRKYLSPKYF